MKVLTYNCKDNDIVLQFHYVDNKIDEVWVQVPGEKGWTVIGYEDLTRSIGIANSLCDSSIAYIK